MKKFFVFIMLMCGFVFALDKAAAVEAVKQNPALLDTPQAQQLLKEKGLSKQDVLKKVAGKSQKIQSSQEEIQNKIENINEEVKNTQTSSVEKGKKQENNLVNKPLKYLPEKTLIKLIRSKQQKEVKIKLKRYGEKFFYNKNTLNKQILAVPEYYQVNVGDVVVIEIFGGNDKKYELKVDNYGNINLPVLGPLHVAGLSVAEVKDIIKKKLSPTYPNSTIVVNVKVDSFIQVTLSGFVNAPGIYNLSSLSTVKDLLIAANGFGPLGSMREVYLKRNGRVIKKIDFYQLIKDGDIVDTTLLRNGDVIYVPKAKKLVYLWGAVNTPAIYELKNGEKLKDLVRYAGGLKPDASKKSIKITRFINNSFTKVLFKNIDSNITLLNGDRVYVYKISELNKDMVYVYGNIEKPGSYELPKDKKLSTLLKKLSYLKDTYYDYGIIERFDGELVSFNLKNPGDITLKSKDNVYIFNKYQVLPNFYVKVQGDVVKYPVKLKFLENMTLKDAINNAGLKTLFDKSKVKIIRYNEKMEPKTFFVDYNKYPDFKLKPFDEISLYKYTDFNPLKPLTVYGEVNKPDIYPYSDGIRLKDAIDIAGGFTYKADKHYIELIRYEIVNNERIRKILKLDYFKDKNYIIKPYDEIFVKRIPNWYDRKTVTIKGEVKYPGTYVIKTGERLADIIKRAGGFTKNAYLYAAVFTRESVKKMQEKRLKTMIYKLKKKVAVIAASARGAGEGSLDAKNLVDAIDALAKQAEKLKPIGRIALILDKNLSRFEKSPYNVRLENNDTLYIPSKKDSVTVMGEVLTPTAFVYTDKNALNYIKKAGGLTDMADDIYFVVHANGFTEKGEFGGWFSKDIEVKPGDAVTVPIKIQTATWYGIAKDITAIVYQLAITAASLKTVGAL